MKLKLKELIEDIKYGYRNFIIFDIYYNIKNGIKNLWTYRSVIWNDRWYNTRQIYI